MTKILSFDTDKLSTYLSNHIAGFAGPLSAKKFDGGQSNPTYLLTTPNTHYVLRRKPPGKLLTGAHAVDREFKVLSALLSTPLPVAKALHLCDDDAVIGSMFYVMEYMQGRVLWDPSLPDTTPERRTAIYQEMNRILVTLHNVDIDKVGLSDFGKKGDYFARQTHTWTKQYHAAETRKIEAMEALVEWLPANMPAQDGRYSITHGDFRLDNLMFHAERDEVIAVLDWELSTIGHPLADLAYQCMQYYLPRLDSISGLAGCNLAQLGIPSEHEYIELYCQRMQIDEIPNWHFYLAFSMFRLASICQGVVKRGQMGNASSDKAGDYESLIEPLANIAIDLTQ